MDTSYVKNLYHLILLMYLLGTPQIRPFIAVSHNAALIVKYNYIINPNLE